MNKIQLEDKINKVMRDVAHLNGEEYHVSYYNPHPYPGWEPELQHYMWGFIRELKEKEAAGVGTKVDLQTLSELFDIIIELTETEVMETSSKKSVEDFGNAATAFNYKLLSTINDAYRGEVKNVFVSPGRLQAILVLLSNWCSGYRDQVMAAICCKKLDQREILGLFADELFLVPNANREDVDEGSVPTIELKTMLWYQKGQEFLSEGLRDTEKHYKVGLKEVNFRLPSTMKTIRKTVEEATHGLVKNLQVNVNDATRALLTDIFYFKAQWEKSFDEYDTKEKNFYYKGGHSKVRMMDVTNRFGYYETDQYQTICLDYRSCVHTRKYSMWIHLPKRGRSIGDVLEEISTFRMGPKFGWEEVHLTMPRFEMELKTSLKEILCQLGLDNLFDSDDVMPNLLREVKIEDIFQQGKLSVDENGTEAAVVTCCCIEAGCMPFDLPKPIEMKVNHEFIFEILDTYSGIRLFSGIVNKL